MTYETLFDKPYMVIHLTKEGDFFRNDFQSYTEAQDHAKKMLERKYVTYVSVSVLEEEWKK